MLVITPTKGDVEAGGSQELTVDLCGKKVGHFAHQFVFGIVGSDRKCHLTIELVPFVFSYYIIKNVRFYVIYIC